MSILDDPRSQRSDELSFRAERRLSGGDIDAAKELFSEAAELESELADDVPPEQRRLKSALAVSAVSLWYRAGRFERGIRMCHRFLAQSDRLTTASINELEDLWDRMKAEGSLEDLVDDPMDLVPLNIKLDGGRIRRGVAPATLVKRREETVISQLTRVVEWKMSKPYRTSGGATVEVNAQLEVFSTPAKAASYGIRLFLLPGDEPELEHTRIAPASILKEYLTLAQAALSGVSSLAQFIEDEKYLQYFAKSFREMAPDGSDIGSVTFESQSWRHGTYSCQFLPEHRNKLSRELGNWERQELPTLVRGVLMGADLTVSDPWINLETNDGETRKVSIDPDTDPDAIRAKFNRNVVVQVEDEHRSRTGRPIATDISLVELGDSGI